MKCWIKLRAFFLNRRTIVLPFIMASSFFPATMQGMRSFCLRERPAWKKEKREQRYAYIKKYNALSTLSFDQAVIKGKEIDEKYILLKAGFKNKELIAAVLASNGLSQERIDFLFRHTLCHSTVSFIKKLLKRGANVHDTMGGSIMHPDMKRGTPIMESCLPRLDSVGNFYAHSLNIAALVEQYGGQLLPPTNKMLVLKAWVKCRSRDEGFKEVLNKWLHRYVKKGDMASVAAMLEGEADVNSRDPKNNMTPLMYTVFQNDEQLAKLLLNAKADPFVATPEGETAISMARDRGYNDLAELLRQARPTDEHAKKLQRAYQLACLIRLH